MPEHTPAPPPAAQPEPVLTWQTRETAYRSDGTVDTRPRRTVVLDVDAMRALYEKVGYDSASLLLSFALHAEPHPATGQWRIDGDRDVLADVLGHGQRGVSRGTITKLLTPLIGQGLIVSGRDPGAKPGQRGRGWYALHPVAFAVTDRDEPVEAVPDPIVGTPQEGPEEPGEPGDGFPPLGHPDAGNPPAGNRPLGPSGSVSAVQATGRFSGAGFPSPPRTRTSSTSSDSTSSPSTGSERTGTARPDAAEPSPAVDIGSAVPVDIDLARILPGLFADPRDAKKVAADLAKAVHADKARDWLTAAGLTPVAGDEPVRVQAAGWLLGLAHPDTSEEAVFAAVHAIGNGGCDTAWQTCPAPVRRVRVVTSILVGLTYSGTVRKVGGWLNGGLTRPAKPGDLRPLQKALSGPRTPVPADPVLTAEIQTMHQVLMAAVSTGADVHQAVAGLDPAAAINNPGRWAPVMRAEIDRLGLHLPAPDSPDRGAA